MTYITAVHMAGGTQHQHIAGVRWLNGVSGKSDTTTTAAMIEFMDKGNAVQVGGSDGPVTVSVVRPERGTPYLRTHADKQWNDNLLALPRY